MHKCLIVLLCVTSVDGVAQEFAVPAAAADDDAALARAMPELAMRLLAQYRENDRETYLDKLFRLQLVAGRYAEAVETIARLREQRSPKIPDGGAWIDVQYEVFAKARLKEASDKLPFADAYRQVFRNTVGRLDDRTSALVVRAISVANLASFDAALKVDRDGLKGKNSIGLAAAVKLVADYQVADEYRLFTPLAGPAIEEDDRRRYVAAAPTAVKLANGSRICTLVWRSRAQPRLPTLLTFTIYAGGKWPTALARSAASRGYASVVAFTRGKACSPDEIAMPYRRDGQDAAALIDLISAQPWSDGRVGMYGGSYSGFTAWATAKHMPKGLKAIAVGAPVAPGLDVPMEGNVFWNFVYPWPFYTTDNKELDDAIYNDASRWRRLNHDWYASGRAYRELDRIDGKPNPIFNEWISHPSYDKYWQQLIPFEKDFARIDIPILQTAGYYGGGPGAAVYYFTEHSKRAPEAEHYLLIGPYDHFGAQVGVVGLLGAIHGSLEGMTLDPAALIDIEDVRFQFFDYVFKNAARPALLEDKVNYEVTGANVWKHAPSLEAMAKGRLRLHLSPTKSENSYRLTESKPPAGAAVTLAVDMADRSDADRKAPGGGLVDKEVDAWNGLKFVSDPLPATMELSGVFSGHLEFVANKKDFDFEIDLYELNAKGEYIQLAPYWSRASYVGHQGRRRLLTAGKRERFDIQSIRLMSRRLEPGSRVFLVLSVIKSPERQINYGTGKDVSLETVRDAKPPLEIKWSGESYVDLPVGR